MLLGILCFFHPDPERNITGRYMISPRRGVVPFLSLGLVRAREGAGRGMAAEVVGEEVELGVGEVARASWQAVQSRFPGRHRSQAHRVLP